MCGTRNPFSKKNSWMTREKGKRRPPASSIQHLSLVHIYEYECLIYTPLETLFRVLLELIFSYSPFYISFFQHYNLVETLCAMTSHFGKRMNALTLLVHFLLLITTSSSFHLGERTFMSNALRGGSVVTLERYNGTLDTFENGTSSSSSTTTTTNAEEKEESSLVATTEEDVSSEMTVSNATDAAAAAAEMNTKGIKPMKVLFLSADTGGGHRASAQSLMHQVRFFRDYGRIMYTVCVV